MEQKYININNKIFIKTLLKKGKKNNTEKILKKILIKIKKKTKKNPNIILNKAIFNISPKIKTIELPKKRKWKKNKRMNSYFLFFLNKDKQIKTSIRWLFFNSNIKKIDNEIIKTAKNKSRTILFKKNYYQNIKKIKFNLNL